MKRSDTSKRLNLIGVLLLLGLFVACVHAPVERVSPCTQTPETVERVLAGFAGRFWSLSGHVRVKVTTPRDHYAFSGDLYACWPDQLHFDVFGFLHRPRFVMIRSGSLLYWRDFGSGRHYAGPLESCPLLPVRFPFSSGFLKDFTRILFMNFPPLLNVTPAGSPCRFILTCGWGTFDLKVDPERGYPLELTGPLGKSSMLHVTFADYSDDSPPFPCHMGIAMGEERVDLTFKTLEINPSIPDHLFVPLPPS